VGARGALLALSLVAVAGCGGGDDKPAESKLPAAPTAMTLASPQIKDGGAIPQELTCDGAGKTPTITWREAPAGQAVELVLVVEDPDAKDGFIHWTAYGLTAATGSGLAPDGQFPAGTKYGKNSAGKTGWTPPCPPEGDDAHRYIFSMYALKDATGLPDGASPDEVLAKLDGAVAKGSFTGTYKRAG
jgi:Raf kinase inhibitor-like YbhB/YbcL family protein